VIRFGAFLWLFCGTAFAAEYRHVTLDNGREVLAEIVTINAEGMNLRLPQGNLIVPPNTPAIFAPLSAAEFEQQQPWKVAILPFGAVNTEDKAAATAAQFMALRVLEELSAVRPMSPIDIPIPGRDSDKRALAQCGMSLPCATRLGDSLGLDVVVMGQIDRDGTLHLGAVFVQSPAARKRVKIELHGAIMEHRDEIYRAQYNVLFIATPEKARPEPVVRAPIPVVSPPAERAKPAPAPERWQPPPQSALNRMAWAPVPGLPSLAQRDMAGFGAALGVATVGASVGVAVAGTATTSTAQFVTMSLLSSYTATVVANHLFGLSR
jgi:hypothetical protein